MVKIFRILVVEDDDNISRLLELELEHEGYEVEIAKTGEEALERYEEFKPDIIILDIMLPEYDGYEVAQMIREYDEKVGIIMLTAKDRTKDKVKGLKTGADDYVVKPFEIEELLARIESLLRRLGKTNEIKIGILEIDTLNKTVFVNGEEVHLTPKEYELLLLLAENRTRTLSKEQILEEIWGYDENPNVVEVYVNYLRKKLKEAGKYIKTIRGFGYTLKEV